MSLYKREYFVFVLKPIYTSLLFNNNNLIVCEKFWFWLRIGEIKYNINTKDVQVGIGEIMYNFNKNNFWIGLNHAKVA